jgi:hypothetical protein
VFEKMVVLEGGGLFVVRGLVGRCAELTLTVSLGG